METQCRLWDLRRAKQRQGTDTKHSSMLAASGTGSNHLSCNHMLHTLTRARRQLPQAWLV